MKRYNHKVALVLPFPKCGLPFVCVKNPRRYERVSSKLENFRFIKEKLKLTKTLYISGNFQRTKKADHIL